MELFRNLKIKQKLVTCLTCWQQLLGLSAYLASIP
ncbi:hypothetical protein ACWI_30870 [Acetobacterium wieringae]|uniref:Uncharacterized protein n=1 Tax=Acetobacterium wieringae TaxID=52694 RepID=A0A1F2PDF5_9FIRM|nr:hypothetical protein ACWI_30870 [Acetobacterium wieringae]